MVYIQTVAVHSDVDISVRESVLVGLYGSGGELFRVSVYLQKFFKCFISFSVLYLEMRVSP